MAVKSKHPEYLKMDEHWELGRDSYTGEASIKAKTTKYLPPTSGQILDGQGLGSEQLGEKAYQAYLKRAVYPDLYKDAVEAAIGIMHRKEAAIELPESMEVLRDDATLLGESLIMLLRRINVSQLTTGRVGILGDVKKDGAISRPIIATYAEKAIINWNDVSVHNNDVDLSLVVLDESSYEMEASFEWAYKERYRVLALTDGEGAISMDGVYGFAEMGSEQEVGSAEFQVPQSLGQTLDVIPFVFVNSKDLSPVPDLPPLLGLANLSMTIYRGEADYRQNLFMQGQDTLVRIGAQGQDDEAVRTGAGARIDVPINGDAKYIGVSSLGLPEQRAALQNDYSRANQKSGQLIDTTSRAKESGDALKIRVAAQTATLPQIAMAGAAGLEKVLRAIAPWFNANPDDIVVTPNLDFTNDEVNGKTLIDIMSAKALGAPISEESIHNWITENGLSTLSYEDELALINGEEPRL